MTVASETEAGEAVDALALCGARFRAICTAEYTSLLQHARKFGTRNQADAEDAVQASVLALWMKREALLSGDGPDSAAVLRRGVAYLYATARGHMLNGRREHAAAGYDAYTDTHAYGSPSEALLPPDETVALAELNVECLRAIDRLSERERAVFEAARLGGASLREVAEQLQISRGSVQRYLDRALQKLRAALGHWENDRGET